MEVIEIIKLKEKAIAIPGMATWDTFICLIAIGLDEARVAPGRRICRRLHFFPDLILGIAGGRKRRCGRFDTRGVVPGLRHQKRAGRQP